MIIARELFNKTKTLNGALCLTVLKKAEAELAFELQAAKIKQQLREEELQIEVVERTQQILVQEQEIIRKEKELDATVRRPAEAEKYRYNDVGSL